MMHSWRDARRTSRAGDGDVGRARTDHGDLRASSDFLPTILRALIRPATVTRRCPAGRRARPGFRFGPQRIENMEALGLGDVLEVDAAEGGLEEFDVLMMSSGSLVARQSGKASTPPRYLKSMRLAFHHGDTGFGADVAQAEDARAVGDDGHSVPLVGVLVRLSQGGPRSPGRARPRPACTRWQNR